MLKNSALFFISAAAPSAMSVLLLPLATLRLGPVEYGVFAIGMSIHATTTALASASAGYLLHARLHGSTAEERRGLLSSAAYVVGITSLVVGVIAIFLVSALVWTDLVSLQTAEVYIVCIAAAVAAFPWLIAMDVLTLDGKAREFVLITISQVVTQALALLTSLFVFKMHGVSLAVAVLAASSVAGVFSWLILRRDLEWSMRKTFAASMMHEFPSVAPSRLLDVGTSFLERVWLAKWAGLVGLGIYNHADLYRNTMMLGVNAISRGFWPIHLREARDTRSEYRLTKASWTLAQVGIVFTAVVFSLFGKEFIDLLTNSKFTDAWIYVSPLLLVLLIQSAGKPQMAVLIAMGQGAVYARNTTFAMIVGIIVLVMLIPLLGIAGAVIAIATRYLILRLAVIYSARRLRKTPFQDGWVLVGICLAGAAYIWNLAYAPGTIHKLLVISVLCALFSVIAISNIRYLIAKRPAVA